MKALILGNLLCVSCLDTAAILKDKGCEVEVQDVSSNPDALALFSLLDGNPDNLPLVILRGVPKGGL